MSFTVLLFLTLAARRLEVPLLPPSENQARSQALGATVEIRVAPGSTLVPGTQQHRVRTSSTAFRTAAMGERIKWGSRLI
jgi:hypothetical protein